MKDYLEKMLEIQRKYQAKQGKKNKDFKIENVSVGQIGMAIAAEGMEIWEDSGTKDVQEEDRKRNMLGGKWWKRHAQYPFHDLWEGDMKAESVDVLHFLLLLWLKLGMSPKEIFEQYNMKMGINVKRQKEDY